MTEPLRILHVLHALGCGGAENMLMNIYRNIDREKIQFDFLVHTDQKTYFDTDIEKMGGKIYRIPYFNGFNFRSYFKALNSFFANNNYKIVHGHLGSCAALYLYVAKKYGAYTIAHSHSTKPIYFTAKNLMYRIYSYPTRYIADYFFACSEKAGEDRYGKEIWKHREIRSIIKNAIDINKYTFRASIRQNARQKLGVKNQFTIGHIGRFDRVKNQSFVLKIFNEVKKTKSDSVLVLVGDGVLKNEIKERVIEMGLNDSVIFTGVRSDVPDLLQAMDCFVFPSLYEGLGIVAIEAQATGLPCVVSDVIPNEAKITDLVKAFSLQESPEKWAAEICAETIPRDREKYNGIVRDSGYDITDTSKWLMNFYIERGRKIWS